MRRRYWVTLAVVFISTGVAAQLLPLSIEIHQADTRFDVQPLNKQSQPEPTIDQILEWWKTDTKAEIKRIIRITLKGKEVAFLASVQFPERGRNFQLGSLLIRPDLKQVREITETGHSFEVYDPDVEGASAVRTEGFGSGQGTTNRVQRALYFDGWEPVILHEMRSGDNLGWCGDAQDRACVSNIIRWTFVDLDGDSRADLVELIIEREGPSSKNLVWTVKTNAYLFKDGRFVLDSVNTNP